MAWNTYVSLTPLKPVTSGSASKLLEAQVCTPCLAWFCLFALISAYTHMYMMCICGMYLYVCMHACATVHLWSSGDSMLRWPFVTYLCETGSRAISHGRLSGPKVARVSPVPSHLV